jgi:putative ABC transport system permease protein
MFHIALRTLRFRKGGFLATFIALFFGAAMVMACGGLLETGVRTEVPPHRLASTQLVVAGDQTVDVPRENPDEEDDDKDKTKSVTLTERVRLDQNLVGTVRSVPGVASAVGDVSFPVMPLGHEEATGHGWASAALTPYTLNSGTPPAAGQVVIDRPFAAVGDRIDVLVRGKVQQVTVSGIASAADPGTVAGSSPAIFFADGDAAGLVPQPGSVDLIAVTASPGTDLGQLGQRISDALRGEPVSILAGTDRGIAEFPEALVGSETLIVLAGVIGGFCIMVAMFVVASTLGLSIQHRGRELALLRAIGTTPRQLRRMVLGEALVVGVIATGLAAIPGAWLGRWLFDRLVGFGAVQRVIQFHQEWIPTIVGIGAGLLTTLVAGYAAARRAGATRPTEALADASIQRRWLGPVRMIGAVLSFGGGIALAIITMTVFDGPIAASTAGPSVMLWAVGLAFISPGITKVMTAILRWPLRAVTGLAGYLAMLNARARTVRLAAAVTPIMLATGIATANLYLQTTQVDAAQEAFARNLRADVVLTSTTGDGLAPDLIDAVRAVPGVAGASEFASTVAHIVNPYDDAGDEDGSPVQGISADGAAETTAVTITAGSLADLRGDTVALPASRAAGLGRHVGDTITMMLGDRSTVDVRIVALFAGDPGYEKLLMPAGLVVPHTTSGLPAQILVKAAAGVSTGELAGELAKVVAGRPGVAMADRAAVSAAFADRQQTQASVNYLLVGMIMLYTAISVVNTLVMATAQRRREFGLQRLTGSTRGQVIRMMSVEAILVAGIGIVLGTIVAAATLVPFSLVVSDSPLPSGPPWIYLAVIGVATLMAVVATVLPAWFATRGRPAEAATAGE